MSEELNWLERTVFKTFNFAGRVTRAFVENARGELGQVLVSVLGTGICQFGLTSGLFLGLTSSLLKHLMYKPLFAWIDKNQKSSVTNQTRKDRQQYLSDEASGILFTGLFLIQWLVPMQICQVLFLPRIENWVNASSLTQLFPTFLTLNSGLIQSHPIWFAMSSFAPAMVSLALVLTFK